MTRRAKPLVCFGLSCVVFMSSALEECWHDLSMKQSFLFHTFYLSVFNKPEQQLSEKLLCVYICSALSIGLSCSFTSLPLECFGWVGGTSNFFLLCLLKYCFLLLLLDGTISPPFEQDAQQLPMFSSDICRCVNSDEDMCWSLAYMYRM